MIVKCMCCENSLMEIYEIEHDPNIDIDVSAICWKCKGKSFSYNLNGRFKYAGTSTSSIDDIQYIDGRVIFTTVKP